MSRVDITYPGDTITQSITALVRQPVSPSSAPPIDIGLVEISHPAKQIPGPPGPPGPGVIVSDMPPADPYDGMLWWESDTATLWAWYEDPDSGQWTQISGGVGGDVGDIGDMLVTATGGSVARPLADHTAEPLSVLDFGEVGSGTADDAAVFATAITYGGDIYVPPGTYKFNSRATVVLTRDTRITFSPDARIILDADIPTQAFSIQGGGVYSCDISGGYFDASAALGVASGNAGSVWELFRLRRFSVSNGEYKAGADYLANRGDTGIEVTICGPGTIIGNRFVGWKDAGIYTTGGLLSPDRSDDGGPLLISGNSFELCLQGITVKRRNRNIMISGNHFTRCHYGVALAEVPAPEKQPGEQLTITGNTFSDVVTAALLARGNGYLQFTGNHVTDWGYNLAGVFGGLPNAILLHGCSDCTITGNTFALRTRTPEVGIVGITIANGTFEGVAYTAGNNLISGNRFHNMEKSIVEGNGVNPNFYVDNISTSMLATPYYTLTNLNSLYIGAHGPGDYRVNNRDEQFMRLTTGGLEINLLFIDGKPVVGLRNQGWTAMTGTADEATVYNTASVTLPQLAGRVMALQAALTTHGLIGT